MRLNFLYRLVLLCCSALVPLMGEATVDLTQNGSIITLEGPWTYRIGAVDDAVMQEGSLPTVTLPHFFEGETGSTHGAVTLSLELRTRPGVPLAIDMQRPFSVWRLYVEGVLVASSGEIDASRGIYRPHHGLRLVTFTPTGETTRLTLQVGNTLHKHLGFYGAPVIAVQQVLERSVQMSTIIESVIAAVFTFFGLYHIALFLVWQRDKAPLWFGLMCIDFSLRAMTTGSQALLFYLPHLSWETMIHLEYLSGYSVLPLFVIYIDSLYPQQSWRRAKHLYLMFSALFLVFVITTPIAFFTSTLGYYELIVLTFIVYTFVVLYRSHRAGELGSKFAFFAFIIFAVAIVHDLLRFDNLVPTPTDLLPFGFLIYLIAQGGILLLRYAAAFKTVATHKESLEHLVDTRTQELRIALDQHRLLLRELTHRVKNNLQFIMGLIGIVRKQDEADPKVILNRLELQIQSIASVHETLCNQGRYEAVEMDKHMHSIVDYLGRFYPKLQIALEAEPILVKSDQAVALGLIVNELVANHVKYASQQQTVRIVFERRGAQAALIYGDGHDYRSLLEHAQSHMFGSIKLGWPMIRAFVRQIDGSISADASSVVILFPVYEVAECVY